MATPSARDRFRPPLWARWAVSLLVAAGLVVALVAFVDHNSNTGLAHVNARAERRAAREAIAVVGLDQAPQTVPVASGQHAAAVLTRAVRSDMRHRIATGNVDGPLQGVRCHAGAHRGPWTAYRCVARAQDVRYPFLAVVRRNASEVTFCKRDYPPVPSQNIPVSRRCRL